MILLDAPLRNYSIAANVNMGFGIAINDGAGSLSNYNWGAFSGYCLRRGVRFADMNGDGR